MILQDPITNIFVAVDDFCKDHRSEIQKKNQGILLIAKGNGDDRNPKHTKNLTQKLFGKCFLQTE